MSTVDSPVVDVSVEIVIRDEPLGVSVDPEQFGHGIVGLGTVRMHGRPITETFVKTNERIQRGNQLASGESKINDWGVGDTILTPDSRQLPYGSRTDLSLDQYESAQIVSVKGDQLNVSQPFEFEHRGATDSHGEIAANIYLANLSPNIVIRSERPVV